MRRERARQVREVRGARQQRPAVRARVVQRVRLERREHARLPQRRHQVGRQRGGRARVQGNEPCARRTAYRVRVRPAWRPRPCSGQ